MKAIVLVIAFFIGIIAVAVAGFSPDPYLEHVRHIPPPHPYPVSSVVWIGIFLALQTSVVFAILRPATYRHSWGRALFGFFVSVGFLGFGLLGSMHANAPISIYILWLLAFVGVMFFVFVWSAVGAARSSAGT